MDITWHINQKFTTDQGRVVKIEPLHVWENVKLGHLRFSIEENAQVMDIEYQNCIFPAIPVHSFLIMD